MWQRIMEWWTPFVDWMYSFGAQYGVDPLIFALLYFGTIPFNIFALFWLGQRLRKRRSPIAPLLLLFFSWVGTYVYLFSVGQNIPTWVYTIVILMMLGSAVYTTKRIQRLRQRYRDELN
ncbi:MAG: hypothetical protein AAGH79_17260 [Bacteroidota bacterium]